MPHSSLSRIFGGSERKLLGLLPPFLSLLLCSIFLSLKQCIIPWYESLKSVLDDNEKIIKAFRCPAWDFLKLDSRNVDPKMRLLKELGVPIFCFFSGN